MTKIIILITLLLVILSLYVKNKKINKIKKYFIFLSILAIFNMFSTKTIINIKTEYLYGASDFEKYASYAQETMRKNGVYASLTLAQAAQEQGLKVPSHNNLFGIKADSSWKGEKVYLKTRECGKNGCYTTWAWFRKYDTVEGSFTDHGDWLINKFANRGAFRVATTLKEQLISLKSNPSAQYATDPNYLCSLASIIKKYDLTKYDEGITFSGRGISITGKHIDDFTIENCVTPSPSVNPDDSDNNSNDIIDYNPGTGYTGNIQDGYIYYRLKSDQVDENLLTSKLNSGEDDKIVSEIYGRVIKGLKYHKNNGENPYIGPGGEDDAGDIIPGSYETWKQYDSRWGHIHLGSSRYTIKSSGCAATSVAIQIARSGVQLSSSFEGYLNPGSFVQHMNKYGGFTSGGAIYWKTAEKIAPNFKYVGKVYVNESNVISTVSSYLNRGDGEYYLIAHLNGSIRKNTSNHWVAVKGVSGDDIKMFDPGGTSTSLKSAYGLKYVDQFAIYVVR